MTRSTAFVACCALVASLAGPRPSLAGQLQPSQAVGVRTSLIEAYYPCFYSAPPIAQHGVPACDPPSRMSGYDPTNVTTLGPKGSLSVSTTTGYGDFALAIQGRDIRNNGVPFDGSLVLRLTVRITDVGCGTPPFYITACSSPDLELRPVSGPISIPCTAGRCDLKTTMNELAPGLIVPGDTTGFQYRDITVLDPDGDPAFRPGLMIQ
jgi:hypothetical protein